MLLRLAPARNNDLSLRTLTMRPANGGAPWQIQMFQIFVLLMNWTQRLHLHTYLFHPWTCDKQYMDAIRLPVLHYDVQIKIILARILGIRMCPRCPHCNQGKRGCQNKFENNALPLGGTYGFCDALAGATEHQGEGTPHFHGLASIVCAYQHSTLQEIAALIEDDLLHVDEIKKFAEHICREDHFLHEEHQRQLPELEKASRISMGQCMSMSMSISISISLSSLLQC